MHVQARRRLAALSVELRSGASRAADRLVTPEFVRRHVERTTRGGQVLAAFLLIAWVPVSLIVVKVVNNMLIVFVLRGTEGPESTPFLITLITFVFLCMAAWFWFQWVRTAGFGMTNFNTGAA